MIAQNSTVLILTPPSLYQPVVLFSVAGDAAFQRVVGCCWYVVVLAARQHRRMGAAGRRGGNDGASIYGAISSPVRRIRHV